MSRDKKTAESNDRTPGGRGPYATIRCPEAAWAKLRETLELDAKSPAFDPAPLVGLSAISPGNCGVTVPRS